MPRAKHHPSDEFDELQSPYRTLRRNGVIREFWRIQVPEDLYDDTDPEAYLRNATDYAINYAREVAPIYRIPCEWALVRWDVDEAIIVRTANDTEGK